MNTALSFFGSSPVLALSFPSTANISARPPLMSSSFLMLCVAKKATRGLGCANDKTACLLCVGLSHNYYYYEREGMINIRVSCIASWRGILGWVGEVPPPLPHPPLLRQKKKKNPTVTVWSICKEFPLSLSSLSMGLLARLHCLLSSPTLLLLYGLLLYSSYLWSCAHIARERGRAFRALLIS